MNCGRSTLFSLMVMALLGLGCATLEVATDFDESVDFSRLETYRWLNQSQPLTGDPRVDNGIVDRRIRDAVDAELVQAGYRKLDTGEVDFLVAYHITIEKTVDVDTDIDRYGVGYGWYGGAASVSTSVTERDEGSLLLDVLDGSGKRLLWRGHARDDLVFESTPDERNARTRAAVDALLAKFPPPGRTKGD